MSENIIPDDATDMKISACTFCKQTFLLSGDKQHTADPQRVVWATGDSEECMCTLCRQDVMLRINSDRLRSGCSLGGFVAPQKNDKTRWHCDLCGVRAQDNLPVTPKRVCAKVYRRPPNTAISAPKEVVEMSLRCDNDPQHSEFFLQMCPKCWRRPEVQQILEATHGM